MALSTPITCIAQFFLKAEHVEQSKTRNHIGFGKIMEIVS